MMDHHKFDHSGLLTALVTVCKYIAIAIAGTALILILCSVPVEAAWITK